MLPFALTKFSKVNHKLLLFLEQLRVQVENKLFSAGSRRLSELFNTPPLVNMNHAIVA